MDCFKKIALTLFVLLALFAGDAMAQEANCPQSYWIKLPAGWTPGSFYFKADAVVPVTLHDEGEGWYSFTLALTGQTNQLQYKGFHFQNENRDANEVRKIGKFAWAQAVDATTAGQFKCSDLGGEVERVYISEDLTTGGTIYGTTPPEAYFFYYLPPNNTEWILGTSVLVFEGESANNDGKFEIDGDHCGWYKKSWFNTPVPTKDAWIFLNAIGKEPDDKVGGKGYTEDPLEWPNGPEGNPTPFNLVQKFGGNPGSLYFNGGNGTWTTTWPNESGVCTYKVGAIIYDTDSDVNPAFVDMEGSGSGTGVAKNIVGSTLVNGKMTFGQAKDNWTAERFQWAFNPTEGKNVVRCYDMPFKRNKSGLWEFNSNKLCTDNFMDLEGDCSGHGGYMGGYFPPDLDAAGDGNYSQCPSCLKKRKAEPWVPLDQTKQSQFCYDRARTGVSKGPNISSCGAALGAEGDFKTGDDPTKTQFWLWGERATMGGLKEAMKNEFFCFESAPATFTYEKGQEFFFSGDDDIWVFINDKLEIDLGGTHLAAPGYVNLDNISGLTPGESYNMNIFFCDRRTTMSNVRIATNMYFNQKSGLYVNEGKGSETNPAKLCMESGGGGSCADIVSGNSGGGGSKILCGSDIIDEVQYFLVNRKNDSDTLFTPPGSLNSACHRDGNKLTCYGGVVINLDEASASVNKERITGITGSWTLYARVPSQPDVERVKIASWSQASNVRMAWGDILGYGGGLITDLCNYSKRYYGSGSQGFAVTGERFPVCISSGEQSVNSFDVDDETAPGATFSLGTSGFKNEFGNFNGGTVPAGLRVFRTETGDDEIPFDELGRPLTIPDNGVLVLWVTGDYKQSTSPWDYKINVSGKTSDEVTLHSMLPRFQWTKAANSDDRPCGYTGGQVEHGSKLDADGCAVRDGSALEYIWVGQGIDLHLRVYNEKSGKTCATCNFDNKSLNWDAKGMEGPGSVSSDGSNALITIPPTGIKVSEGRASFTIQGKKEAMLSGSTTPLKWTTFSVWNPESKLYQATWDTLQFKKPPVPFPENTYIYDDNGDGIGDRIKIVYSRGFRRDSLPNAIEVKWATDTTVVFGLATKGADGSYSNAGITTDPNIAYWTDPNHYIKLGVGTTAATLDDRNNNIDGIALELNTRDTIILLGKFSKGVLTQGSGNLVNWATFKVGSAAATTTPLTGSIDEKIPAIVISAKYTAGGDGCGDTRNSPCRDRVVLELSEPVKGHPNAPTDDADEALRNPFAYLLKGAYGTDAQWGILKSGSGGDVPTDKSVRFGNRQAVRPLETGDSTITFTFNRFRNGEISGTPEPRDSVKFASWKNTGFKDILIDLNGNTPNENEIGKEIEGRKPFKKDKIPIGEVDINNPNYAVENAKDVLTNVVGSDLNNLGRELFDQSRPVELIPIPDGWGINDVKNNFPGTVGILVTADVSGAVSELETRYGLPSGSIEDKDIHVLPKVFYHTNLGNFVAESGALDIKCDDAIFPIGNKGKASCRDKKSQFFIAWDMKDMKGRYVGAGAYVGIYDLRLEVEVPGRGREQLDPENALERKVEMHGVKRIKKR